MSKDMTQGTTWKIILLFSIPIFIGNVFQQLYNMIDTIIVGRFVGMEALAAVGASGSIVFLLLGFAMGMTNGFGVVIAQRFGANDEEGVRKSVAISIVLCLVIAVVLTIIGISCTGMLLGIMNTPDDIYDMSKSYLQILFAGTAATIYYNMIASVLRALGDSKTPLYFLGVSSILNVILDLTFIIVFSMGAAGAAVATVISQLAAAILCTLYTAKHYPLLHLKRQDFKLSLRFIMVHLKIGVPMALQFSVTAIGVMVLQAGLNVFGSTVIAAYTAASKVEMFITQPLQALGVTATTFCGQNLGAGRIDRIKKGIKDTTIMCVISSLLAMGIGLFLGDIIVRLFIEQPTEEVLGYSRQYLTTISLFFIPLGILLMFRNALQGMGDSLFPMLGGIGEFVARLAAVLILPGFMGYAGICLASPIAWVTACLVVTFRYVAFMRKHSKPKPKARPKKIQRISKPALNQG